MTAVDAHLGETGRSIAFSPSFVVVAAAAAAIFVELPSAALPHANSETSSIFGVAESALAVAWDPSTHEPCEKHVALDPLAKIGCVAAMRRMNLTLKSS